MEVIIQLSKNGMIIMQTDFRRFIRTSSGRAVVSLTITAIVALVFGFSRLFDVVILGVMIYGMIYAATRGLY